MYPVIDTNHTTTAKLAQLKAQGITTIIRYINPLGQTSEKTVKPPEARAIAVAGLKMGLVCEGWGGAGQGGVAASINATTGLRDAQVCQQYAPSVGAQDGACIYFAVDTDVSSSDINKYVIPYFQSVARQLRTPSNLPKYRVGIYGCGTACAALLSADLVDLTWLSNAMGWSGSRGFRDSKQWNLLQHLPQTIAGLDTDPDETNPDQPDIGDFIPFGAIPAPPPADIAWIQGALNQLLALNPPLDVDGDFGPLSKAACAMFLRQELIKRGFTV